MVLAGRSGEPLQQAQPFFTWPRRLDRRAAEDDDDDDVVQCSVAAAAIVLVVMVVSTKVALLPPIIVSSSDGFTMSKSLSADGAGLDDSVSLAVRDSVAAAAAAAVLDFFAGPDLPSCDLFSTPTFESARQILIRVIICV